MAIKLEKVVEKFYLALEEGKILGRRCPACGAVEFPPVYACNSCGNLETEWYEISGKGVLKSIVLPAALSSKPEYDNLGQRNFVYGEVELEEGARFNAVVRGINKKKRDAILAAGKLPVPVKAAIFQREGGYKTVVFDLVEE